MLRPVAALLCAGLLLAGCGGAPSGRLASPEMGYLHLGPLFLPTRTLEIDRGNVDGGPLADAAYLWAQDRLQPAAGGTGIARFVLKRAEIRERPYGGPTGRDEGMVTRALRYQAQIEAEVQFLSDQNAPRGVAVGRGGGVVLLAEDANPAEQERALDRLLSQAIAGMNDEFERALARRR